MPLSNSTRKKLEKKSFKEKEFTGKPSTEFEVGVDIDTLNYFQIFQGVCIQTPMTTNHTNVTGINIFQPKRMIWSYRNLGNVTRTQINVVMTINVFIPNHIHPGIQLKNTLSIGDSQPPKNIVTARIETNQILAYSAIWNIAQDIPEYSTM
jgi:hypothetical protein